MNYSDAGNWSTADVPVNGIETYDVVIPPSSGTINFDVDTASTINTLSVGVNTVLDINNTKSLTVLDDADLSGTLQTIGGTYIAASLDATFGGNAARIFASGGGTIQHTASAYDGNGVFTGTLFSAAGLGTTLDLSAMTELQNLANAGGLTVRKIEAVGGATLDLSGLQTLRGGVGGPGNDRLDVVVRGSVPLTNLIRINDTDTGNVRFEVGVAGFSLPALQTAVNTTFDIDPGLTVDLPALIDYRFTSSDATHGVLGVSAGSTINAGMLTTVHNAFIEIGTGGTLNVPGLNELTESFLTYGADQTLSVGSLGDVDNTRIFLSGGKTLVVADTAYDGTNIFNTETIFSAAGAGTTLDLSAMTELNNLRDQSGSPVRTIEAVSGGTLDMRNVTTLQGGATGATNDRLDIVAAGAGSLVDLSSLTEVAAGNVRFNAIGGGVILLGDLSATDPVTLGLGTTVTVRAGSGGEVRAVGDLILNDLATTTVEIGESGQGLIDVDGTVTLAGTLRVELVGEGGERPEIGEVFVLMTFADRGGTVFSEEVGEFIGVGIETGYALAPIYTDTEVRVRAAVPGDLNLDDRVSVADLSTFALNFNTSPGLGSWELGDFNNDGEIGVADLSLLALNFGFGDETGEAADGLSLHQAAVLAGIDPALVPEPGTWGLLLLLAGPIGLAERRGGCRCRLV